MFRRTLAIRSASSELKDAFAAKVPAHLEKSAWLKKNAGEQNLSDSTVGACYGGMRGVTALVYEPSLLDPVEGIRFRGYSIPECQEKLPKWKEGTEMMPEAMLWLLLTGEIPSQDQTHRLAAELAERAYSNPALMEEVEKTIMSLPEGLHPMNQLVIAASVLGKDSQFAKRYSEGMKKTEYWEPALEDTLNLLARITPAAALIYTKAFKNSGLAAKLDPSLDWSANFTNMMGFDNKEFADLMRLYLSIHTDHEGGNVSAHTTILVASALTDPYLSFAGGMTGLAGPLHGLANQEVLSWLKEVKGALAAKGVSLSASDAELQKTITEVTWESLNSGKVVPGYGHAVLRKTDPRYTCQRDFAERRLPNDELYRLVSNVYAVMPGILTEHGKTKNPFPNVDAHSGCLLQYYGMMEENFYTVLFGVSRAIGVLTAVCWDRASGKPIERPKSITTPALYEKFNS